MDDTLRILSQIKDCFPVINNMNVIALVQNSVYWFDPEKYNIGFYGDKEWLYKKFYFGIPSLYWYSTQPFIDRKVRVDRFSKMIQGFQSAGIHIGPEVVANYHDLIAGVGNLDFREHLVSSVVNHGQMPLPQEGRAKRPPLMEPIVTDRIMAMVGDHRLAFKPTQDVVRLLENNGVPYWTVGGNSALAAAAQ